MNDTFESKFQKRWLYNELEIAGQKIVIPAEGKVGSDWGMK